MSPVVCELDVVVEVMLVVEGLAVDVDVIDVVSVMLFALDVVEGSSVV